MLQDFAQFSRLRLPVIAAPMFIISGPELVIAQCKAGVVGSFPALNARPVEKLDEWLTRIKSELAADPNAAPFAVNQIIHPSNERLEHDMALCVKHEVPLIITSLWGIGGTTLIFLAGLQGVPQELYEAAEIDGAGSWAKTRHITLPMLTPTIFFNLVLGLIGTRSLTQEIPGIFDLVDEAKVRIRDGCVGGRIALALVVVVALVVVAPLVGRAIQASLVRRSVPLSAGVLAPSRVAATAAGERAQREREDGGAVRLVVDGARRLGHGDLGALARPAAARRQRRKIRLGARRTMVPMHRRDIPTGT